MVLLLTATLATSPVGDPPEANVAFGGRDTVRVFGPSNKGREEYPWTVVQTLLSPRGDAAAVRFCWEAIKYHGCQVRLARPDGTVAELKNSDVRRLLWTPDGKYLIGAGNNTVRLWNLAGGVRTAIPTPGSVFAPLTRHSSQIVGLTLRNSELCVRTEDQWYDRNGQQKDRSVSTTRYVLPTLKPLEPISQPVQAGWEAPCHLPHTEP